MLSFDTLKKTIYTLFSGLFLIAGVKTTTLPLIASENTPVDTLDSSQEYLNYDKHENKSDGATSVTEDYKTTVVRTPIKAQTTVASAQSAPAAAPAYDHVSFGNLNIPIFYSNDTMIDAGSQAGLYNGRFLYGHNSANVFGLLPYLGYGAHVTITLGGQTRSYHIANQITLEKREIEQKHLMKAFVNARLSGTQYDYAMMTCAGTSYGNGDASHRTIVFLVLD